LQRLLTRLLEGFFTTEANIRTVFGLPKAATTA